MSAESATYEATVPDTLDLAERARVAINGLTRIVDPEHNYQPYHFAQFYAKPPFMDHMRDGVECWGKLNEALVEMRVMSGSEQNLDIGEKTLQGMVSNIKEDGLYYATAENRPWHILAYADTALSSKETSRGEWASLHSHARVMLAILARYQVDNDPKWKKLLGRMADALIRVAVHKDDYAYYPESGIGGEGTYPDGGWKHTNEPDDTSESTQQNIMLSLGVVVTALCEWHTMSGHKKSLDTAGRLVNFMLKRQWWTPDVQPLAMVGDEHAHFKNHIHSFIRGLWGILEYANITNNSSQKAFVRDSYDYIRNFGIARIGLFGETCGAGEMVCLAAKLSDAGVGDYWEDVDQYIRNHLVETQILRADLLENISEAGPDIPNISAIWETSDNVIDRNIGSLFADATHTTRLAPNWTVCCPSNGLIGFYHAWEGIVRYEDDVAHVNLLLNRASPWLDIDSYLPYEGKVVIRNKTARKIAVRIPRWVDKDSVESRIDRRKATSVRLGNYLLFDSVNEGDTLTIKFPVVETTEIHSNGWEGMKWYRHVETTDARGYKQNGYERPEELTQYTCRFKGNTLVDISPRDDNPGYPIYLRDHYSRDKAPLKKVTRHVSPNIVKL